MSDKLTPEEWNAFEEIFGSDPERAEAMREKLAAVTAERDDLAALVREFTSADDERLYDAFGHCLYCGWQNKHTEYCLHERARRALAALDAAEDGT